MIIRILMVIWLSVISINAQENPQKIGFSVVYSIEDESWKDMNDAIKEAIVGEGIVISYTSHAMALLDRTAKDVGVTQDSYLGAQIHFFCKVPLSHKMVKVNPHMIAGCPYSITVYELKSNPGTIYASYRELPTNEPGYKEVIELQKEIIKNAFDL